MKLLTTKVVGEEGSDLPVHDSMMCGSSNAVRFCKSRNALELTCADGRWGIKDLLIIVL